MVLSVGDRGEVSPLTPYPLYFILSLSQTDRSFIVGGNVKETFCGKRCVFDKYCQGECRSE